MSYPFIDECRRYLQNNQDASPEEKEIVSSMIEKLKERLDDIKEASGNPKSAQRLLQEIISLDTEIIIDVNLSDELPCDWFNFRIDPQNLTSQAISYYQLTRDKSPLKTIPLYRNSLEFNIIDGLYGNYIRESIADILAVIRTGDSASPDSLTNPESKTP